VASDSDVNADFSDAFCAFLQRSIATVSAAELLLLLCADPNSQWGPSDIAARLQPIASLSSSDVTKYLETFRQRGLVVRTDADQVQYRPVSPEIDAHVQTLARLYNERPVTLIRIIYALQDKKIKTFADAFKIRGDE
jgi:hypothetical protein